MTALSGVSRRGSSEPVWEVIYDRRALAMWPRLDRSALRHCRHDPRRIAALVSRRTSISVESILTILVTHRSLATQRPPPGSADLRLTGTPRSSNMPRSWNRMAAPTVRSRTVEVVMSLHGPAIPSTVAAMCTAMPAMFAPTISITPV